MIDFHFKKINKETKYLLSHYHWDSGEPWWLVEIYKFDDKQNKISTIHDQGNNIQWYKNDEYHRENDLPARIFSNGIKEWWIEDEFIKDNENGETK